LALTDAHPNLDPNVPDGWSYNPSAWSHRLPITAGATVGFCIAIYLALYQWRIIPNVWDPFFADPTGHFANGSERILNSWVSRLLPVPDAFLGALAYLAEGVASVIGGTSRWRTAPVIVLINGAIVAMLGVVAVALVIFQPMLFHAWCTLCLASAATSLVMVALATAEVLASVRHLRSDEGSTHGIRPVSRAAG
jgi:uncharacterized membrane protein